ncbi:MAG: DUF4252 domain-containing protein [Saprospiraceae bacterium]|nr:DUF4252 domain-containing protein [Saprospiraceae bacterium]
MKKVYGFLAVLILLSAGVAAQENAIATYFTDYLGSDDFTKISVTGKMFSLFTELDAKDEDEQAILEAISKLKGIKGLVRQHAEDGNAMYVDAIQRMEAGGSYDELMTFDNVKEKVRFMIRDDGDQIHELTMVRGAEKEFIIMTLYGDIDLSAISKLSRVMRVHGFDKFGMLGEGEDNHHKRNN